MLGCLLALMQALLLLAITIALLHVHMLASQHMLRREAMVLIRYGLVLRNKLFWGQYLQCTASLRELLVADVKWEYRGYSHGCASSEACPNENQKVRIDCIKRQSAIGDLAPGIQTFRYWDHECVKTDLILLLVMDVGLQSRSHSRHVMLGRRQVHHVLIAGVPAAV